MPNRDAWREVPEPQGVRFVLPPRGLPHLRAVGLGIIVTGLVFDGIMMGITASAWWPALRGLASGPPLGPDAAALIIPLLLVAGMVVPLWMGSLVGFGHAELVMTATHARGLDRAGPFRYRRTVALADIARLVVDATPVKVNDRPVREGPWADIGGLMAERAGENAKPASLVIGYPIATLTGLAEEVRERMGASVAIDAGEAPGVEIVTRDESIESGPVAQPSVSTAVLERTPEGASITLPPMGFFKGSKGLGCFSILWLAFVSIFAVLSVGMIVKSQPFLHVLPFAGVSTLFGAIGVGMFYAAVRSGRRTAVIDVVGPDLLITLQSTGAPKAHAWTRAEIDRVVVGKSGVEINETPVMELQIWPVEGKKVGLFAERSDDELRWIAWEIRAALGLDARPPEADRRDTL